jgi:hypothetical protein
MTLRGEAATVAKSSMNASGQLQEMKIDPIELICIEQNVPAMQPDGK